MRQRFVGELTLPGGKSYTGLGALGVDLESLYCLLASLYAPIPIQSFGRSILCLIVAYVGSFTAFILFYKSEGFTVITIFLQLFY